MIIPKFKMFVPPQQKGLENLVRVRFLQAHTLSPGLFCSVITIEPLEDVYVGFDEYAAI